MRAVRAAAGDDVARGARHDPGHGRAEVDGGEHGGFAAAGHADDGERDTGGKLALQQLEGGPEVLEGDPDRVAGRPGRAK